MGLNEVTSRKCSAGLPPWELLLLDRSRIPGRPLQGCIGEGPTDVPRWLSGKESACQAGDMGSITDGEDPLEKEMAIIFNILAWEIPWTEEPGRLQSMGSQKSWT